MSNAPSDLFSYVDIQRYNPWWENETHLPPPSRTRADLYWRVKNTLANDLLLIPGAAATGTATTLKQIIRALVLGREHENTRIQDFFHREDLPEHIDVDGCKPGQLCYIPCSDSLAHLVAKFVDKARQAYHPRGARTGERDFYLFLSDIHRLDDWQSQLRVAYNRVEREFPEENWTFIASIPVTELADETNFNGIEDVEIDLPHHTQKYRDTLISRAPELRTSLRPADGEDTIERARTALSAAAKGECTAAELRTAFETIADRVQTVFPEDELEQASRTYLTEGGFAPALQSANGQNQSYSVAADAIETHVSNGLATALYQDIPLLAKRESAIPRIEAPENLHGFIALLARRGFRETRYIDLGEYLSCDTRTIRQKFVPIIEQFHIGERSTRYDLEQRNRTLRFYLRSPGYLTAFRGHVVTEADKDVRTRLLLADHLRRLLANIGDDTLLQYWRDDDHVVDYIFDVDGDPILFISEFAEEVGGTIESFEAFSADVRSHNLEVTIADASQTVQVEEVASDRLQLTLPHWILLAIC